LQRLWREKINRENKQWEEFCRQKEILEAKAKAKAREEAWLRASQRPKRPSRAADVYLRLQGYKPPLPPKERTDPQEEKTAQWLVTSLLFQPHHKLLPYSDEAPDWNPGGKKVHVHPMLRHRANPYPDAQSASRMLFFQKTYQAEFDRLMIKEAKKKGKGKRKAKTPPSVPEDMSVEATEAQPSTSTANEVDIGAVRVQPPTRILKNAAVQAVEAQPSIPLTNEVEVEAARVQPSTSVPNDAISEVVNIQIPMSASNNAIVEATNAQPSSPSPNNVSMESGWHTSPMSVDVSMESAENALLSPSKSMGVPTPPIQNDCFSVASGPSSTSGTSSLRVGHVKSSRSHRPYTIRSRTRSSTEGDDFMLDRDKEIAMLEEAAKNVPVFNLPANFSFTENVGHSTTSNLLTDICSQKQPTEHDAKESHTESLPHSTSEIPPAQEMQPTVSSIPNFFANSAALQKPLEIKIPSSMFGTQGSTTFVSNPAPLHAASSISSPSIPFSYGTPSANPPVPSFPIEDPANPLWDGEKKTENAERDQNLSLGQQAYALAGSMSYGGRSSVSDFSVLYLPPNSKQPLIVPCWSL